MQNIKVATDAVVFGYTHLTIHGLFVNDGINKLKDSKLIKKLICTDSHLNTQYIFDEFVEVRSLASLICEAI